MGLEAERFGRAILVRRAELDMERKVLAERAQISYPFLAGIETGTRFLSLPKLYHLADALDLTVAELFARADALPERIEP